MFDFKHPTLFWWGGGGGGGGGDKLDLHFEYVKDRQGSPNVLTRIVVASLKSW